MQFQHHQTVWTWVLIILKYFWLRWLGASRVCCEYNSKWIKIVVGQNGMKRATHISNSHFSRSKNVRQLYSLLNHIRCDSIGPSAADTIPSTLTRRYNPSQRIAVGVWSNHFCSEMAKIVRKSLACNKSFSRHSDNVHRILSQWNYLMALFRKKSNQTHRYCPETIARTSCSAYPIAIPNVWLGRPTSISWYRPFSASLPWFWCRGGIANSPNQINPISYSQCHFRLDFDN